MSKWMGIYLIVFSVLYFFYTVYVAGHGIHFMNSAIALGVLGWGIVILNRLCP